MYRYARRPFLAIGPRPLRFEIGWFDGTTLSLFSVSVLEWQLVKENPQLSYLCVIYIQVLKFAIVLTFLPDRLSDEHAFEDTIVSGHTDCD